MQLTIDTIEINVSLLNQLNEEDRTNLKNFEFNYNSGFNYYQNLIYHFSGIQTPENAKVKTPKTFIEEIKENIKSLNSGFCYGVKYYLLEKYNYSFDEKHFQSLISKAEKIDLETILKIINKEKGLNFNAKAFEELVYNLHRLLKIWNNQEGKKSNATLKNNKISFDSFVYYQSWLTGYKEIEMSYNSRENVKTLFKSLSLFFFKNYEKVNYLDKTLNIGQERKYLKLESASLSEFNFEIKPFKNGRIDMIFADNSQAQNYWNMFRLSQIEPTI